jgi:hypothetical protein
MNFNQRHTSISHKEDLQTGKPLDASEFALRLDHIRNSKGNK